MPTGGALELPKLALSAEIAVGALGRKCGLAEGGMCITAFSENNIDPQFRQKDDTIHNRLGSPSLVIPKIEFPIMGVS